MKKIILGLIALGVFCVIATFATYYWYQNEISSPNGSSKSPIVFEIRQGDSVETIATNLAAKGLLKDKDAFTLYCKFNPELVANFQAGFFEISQNSSIKEIVILLQKAKNKEEIKVMIPEGLRSDEIAKVITNAYASVNNPNYSEADFLNIVASPAGKFSGTAGDFLNQHIPYGKPLEGFLYPDTYFFAKNATAQEIINKMLTTLAGKITQNDLAVISTSEFNFYDTLTLASIVERESLSVNDSSLIAGILNYRITQGGLSSRYLQVDSALQYQAKDWKVDPKTLQQVNTPYNTFLHTGLPPTPISNPGYKTFQATINPATTENHYYLYDNTGQIHYSKTYAEYLLNVKKYL